MDPSLVQWPMGVPPRIVKAGRFPLADRGFVVRYRHPTHALHLHETSGRLRRGGRDEPFVAGVLTLSVGGGATAYDLDRPERLWCVHFDPASGVRPTASLPGRVDLGSQRPYVAERFARIALLTAAGGDSMASAAASAILLEVLLVMARLSSSAADTIAMRSRDAVTDAAARIAARPCDPVDVPRLAAQVGLSQAYLARCFRTRHGMTIQRFQLACRIDEARHLLAHADIAIQPLALRLGFSDAQHFSKGFIRVVGMTPGRYRATHAASR